MKSKFLKRFTIRNGPFYIGNANVSQSPAGKSDKRSQQLRIQ